MKKLLLLTVLSMQFLYSTASADEWTFCANEKGYCTFTGNKKVKYGAGNRWHYLTLSNGTACHNSVFGNPATGVKKRCYFYRKTNYSWKFCARENGKCNFEGKKTIRYGGNGRFYYITLEDEVYCNDDVFGDPIPVREVKKSCYVKVQS